MALTFTVVRRGGGGNSRWVDFTVNFDSSYPTGGETIAAADYIKLFGHDATVATIERVIFEPTTANTEGVLDRTNQKILLFTSGSTEAGNGSNQSAITLNGRAFYGTHSP